MWFEKKKKRKKVDFSTSFEWIQFKRCFENYIIAKIFDASSNDEKVRKKKKNTIQHAILIFFAALFQNYQN